MKIAEEFRGWDSTVGDIKREASIRLFASLMENMAMNKKGHKVMRLAIDHKLDETVYQWFIQKRSQDMPFSGPVLCEKAVQLHVGNSVPPFQASRSWLWRFCNRHGIRQLSLQGEKVSLDTSAVEPFKEELQQLLERERLTLTQLYNCDETGLCYRMLLNKTLTSQSEREASAMKKQNHSVTLMSCSNATQPHKLPLLFIGKAENPRCLTKKPCLSIITPRKVRLYT